LSLGRTENKSVHKAVTHIFKMLRRENNMVVNTSSSQQSIVSSLSKSTLDSSDVSQCVFIYTESKTRSTRNKNLDLIDLVDEEADLSRKISSDNSQYRNNVIVLVEDLCKTINNHPVCKACLSQRM
jgi:hypothetical protein